MPPLPFYRTKSAFRISVLQIIIILICGISLTARAQPAVEEKLIRYLNSAASDSDRIVRLDQLSRYYYANKDFRTGDSLIEKQIMLAEATMNQNLVLLAYFGNAGYQSPGVATKDRSDNAEVYITRALEYAKANDLTDYMAMAYSNLAAIKNTDGKTEEAFKNANLGFTTALNTSNDSAKVICAIALGNTYRERSDILMAFKTYTNAQNIAIQSDRETLLPPVYHAIAALYKELGKDETAKKYVHRSLIINKKVNNTAGRINDIIFLAKLNNYIAGKNYLQEAIALADSTNNVVLKIEAERVLFFYMLLKEKPAYMLDYLEGKPELKYVFINSGPDYYYWMLAEIYLYGGMPDSAIHYFKRAEPSFSTRYDLRIQKGFFGEFAWCYLKLNNIPLATLYYERSFEIARMSSDLRTSKSSTHELKSLYQRQGNFEKAYSYSLLYDQYKDSVDLLGRERDLVLLEIDNVTKQQQRDAELAAEKIRRKHNLQYMLITIIIAAAFVVLIMVGMFRVSALTIRLMGFLSLIFFFEFVILILDHWIHDLTHGEPWKIWLIKIGIISILLPVHHFMEHRLIKYLLSRHLITVRSRMKVSRLFGKKTKLQQKPVGPDEALKEMESES